MTPEKMIKLITKDYGIDPDDFNRYQMDEICLGILHGLSVKDIQKYAHNNILFEKMRDIRLGLEEYRQSIEYKLKFKKTIKLLKKKGIKTKGLEPWQCYQLKMGLKHNLSTRQVKLYANPKLDSDRMFLIRIVLEGGYVSYNEIKSFYANPEISTEDARDKYGNIVYLNTYGEEK